MTEKLLRLLRGMVLAMPLASGVQAADLDHMVVFDGVYIPALALTTAAQQDAAVVARARAAMQRLEVRWPALRVQLQQDLGGTSAKRTLDAVDRHLAAARKAVAANAFSAAHEALEQVRLDLMQARSQRRIDYFVDRLTAYHEPMEVLALAGSKLTPQELTAAKRVELELAFAEARVLWAGIEKNPPDPRVYALSPARAAQLRKGVADETEALSRLSDALRGDDPPALLKAAAALKPAFARVLMAFAHND